MQYRKVVLHHYPDSNFPKDLSCFSVVKDIAYPEKLQKGELLLKIRFISIDPLLRTWISGAKSYLDPVVPGSLIPGFSVGTVLAQNGTPYEVGGCVFGMLSWSELLVTKFQNVQAIPVQKDSEQIRHFLTIYGPTGFTAYKSIKREIMTFTEPLKLDLRIVISSAAGGMGLALIGYLVKLGYTQVYGIAGGPEKCAYAIKAGYVKCIDYKPFQKEGKFDIDGLSKAISEMMDHKPVELYYDNIGEQMLSSVLPVMSDHSKVVLCGATATYNNWKAIEGVANYEQIIMKRIQLKGILYFHQTAKDNVSAFMDMIQLAPNSYEHVLKGIEQLPSAYRDTMAGLYIGKTLVEL